MQSTTGIDAIITTSCLRLYLRFTPAAIFMVLDRAERRIRLISHSIRRDALSCLKFTAYMPLRIFIIDANRREAPACDSFINEFGGNSPPALSASPSPYTVNA